MAHYAKKKRDGSVEIRLPDDLKPVLRHLMRQLDDLLNTSGTPGAAEDLDPLAALTGLTFEARERPDDPALLRLRPDAYAPDVDEGEAAAEYRRFTESDLEQLQRARVSIVLDGLAESGRVTLSEDDVEAWLGALNDGRLAIASRLGIDDDEWEPGPETDETLWVTYNLLSALFHDLLSVVAD